ncbi:PLDc_N domain-containing protein [Candidatus Peribacteria bacterium]|nr:PLDc_N domain-containing protein [Candidatus Peribacteria bacterium]MBT4020922.1 PLDc_N domain-containing protein [Candidatus Peribacteria bacterium]MBT4240480.1 PLDc_N domain-containing protein [Candidatus Peribacteria bacterium]MBT4474364.1 PLDc_N domain-containing protein [Candidatus Peribacteria bacterium]
MALIPSGSYFAGLLAENPVLKAVQYSLTGLAVAHVFIVFLVTRDILKRTNSIIYQISCILVSAALPIVGVFTYLLIRPSRTLSDKNIEHTLKEILKNMPVVSSDEPIEDDIGEKSSEEEEDTKELIEESKLEKEEFSLQK